MTPLAIIVIVAVCIFLLLFFTPGLRTLVKKALLKIVESIKSKRAKHKKKSEPVEKTEQIAQEPQPTTPQQPDGNLEMFGFGDESEFEFADKTFDDVVDDETNLEEDNFDVDLKSELSNLLKSDQERYDGLVDDSVFEKLYQQEQDDDLGIDISIGKYSTAHSQYSEFDEEPIVILDKDKKVSSSNFQNKSLYEMFNRLPKEMKALLIADVLKRKDDN